VVVELKVLFLGQPLNGCGDGTVLQVGFFKDLLLVNPVIEKEVGTPPSLLPTIVCPRKGGIEGNQMKSTEYMYFNT